MSLEKTVTGSRDVVIRKYDSYSRGTPMQLWSENGFILSTFSLVFSFLPGKLWDSIDSHLHTRRPENLKSHSKYYVLS
jgi:hypothetical protein